MRKQINYHFKKKIIMKITDLTKRDVVHCTTEEEAKRVMKITDLKAKDVVHCVTEEEAERVLKLAHEAGYRWNDGDPYSEVIWWSRYGSETCYNIINGEFCDLLYYKNLKYNIISSTEITGDDIKATDTQIGGNHYKNLAIQPMEYCLKNNLNFAQSSVIKYVTRYKDKNGIEDLKKAIHCIELLIEFEEGR